MSQYANYITYQFTIVLQISQGLFHLMSEAGRMELQIKNFISTTQGSQME